MLRNHGFRIPISRGVIAARTGEQQCAQQQTEPHFSFPTPISKELGHLPERRGPARVSALAADGTFGMIRWDERFTPDREDVEGQATCEGGEHLPMIGLVGATLARTIQDFVGKDARHDYLVAMSGVTRTV